MFTLNYQIKGAIFNLVVFKMLYKLPIRISSAKSKQSSGFTLIEVLVTIIIVGILSAIAAPSWLGFVAKQRLNKANDSVLAALQEAQREAKKTKLSYSVSFRTDANIPQISVNAGTTPSNWRSLGADIQVKPEKLLFGTNLDGINKVKSTTTYGTNFSTSNPQTITFNYLGTMERKTDGSSSDTDLKVVLAIPNARTPTQPSDVKRCVIVRTLIGGIQTAKNNDCN